MLNINLALWFHLSPITILYLDKHNDQFLNVEILVQFCKSPFSFEFAMKVRCSWCKQREGMGSCIGSLIRPRS